MFVGINPGEASARSGHYYAHPGNRFWAALSASGLVPRAAGPLDDSWLAEACGIGFTDVVKRVVTDSTKVTEADVRDALPRFIERIAAAQPCAICFTSGRACDEVFPGVRRANRTSGWGRLPVTFPGSTFPGMEACAVWVMPSTSGLAARWRAEGDRVLRDLAAALGRTAETPQATS